MNSEKVKEIKKALEERTQHKPINCSHSECVEACGRYCRHRREFVADMGSKNGQTCENCNEFNAINEVKEYADILNLINELESENELLRNAKVVYETVDYCYEDLKKAEKRIAELEKEIKETPSYAKGYADGIKNTYEVVIPDKLKQFAERLKKKLFDLGNIVNENDIDETLKEFIDG